MSHSNVALSFCPPILAKRNTSIRLSQCSEETPAPAASRKKWAIKPVQQNLMAHGSAVCRCVSNGFAEMYLCFISFKQIYGSIIHNHLQMDRHTRRHPHNRPNFLRQFPARGKGCLPQPRRSHRTGTFYHPGVLRT